MQGFRYVNNSLNIPDCTSLDDEICNGGPHVWTRLPNITESQCLMPCNITGRVSTNNVNATTMWANYYDCTISKVKINEKQQI